MYTIEQIYKTRLKSGNEYPVEHSFSLSYTITAQYIVSLCGEVLRIFSTKRDALEYLTEHIAYVKLLNTLAKLGYV